MSDPIYVTKTTLPDREAYDRLLDGVWKSGIVTNGGRLCAELENKLCERFSAPTRVVSNGTIAIQLALRALKVSGSVITTPFSYVATTNALLWDNLHPIFVDVEPEWLTLDPALVEAAIRPDTTAILATHVYGFPCDVEALADIARRHDLRLIYDAAHAFDVDINGRSLLTYGDLSTLSFHATKVFHTFEGGAVVCGNPDLSEDLHLLRTFGHEGRDYRQIGINAKMSEIHAAAGIVNLSNISELIAKRRALSETYHERLTKLPLRRLETADRLGLTYNYAYFPVFCERHADREAVVEKLNAENIFPRRYFEPSLNTLPFLDPGVGRSCPVSERAARTVLCLPLYADLSRTQVHRICDVIESLFRR